MCVQLSMPVHTHRTWSTSQKAPTVVGVIIIIGLLLEAFLPLLVLHCACGPRYATISPLFL